MNEKNGHPPENGSAGEHPPSHANGESEVPFKAGPGKLHPVMAKNIWKPGQTGNPKGSTQTNKIKGFVRSFMLHRTIKIPGQNGKPDETVTMLEAFTRSLVSRAINGSAPHARILADILWPQKGNRMVIQKNTLHLSFELDAPPEGNDQAEFHKQLMQLKAPPPMYESPDPMELEGENGHGHS